MLIISAGLLKDAFITLYLEKAIQNSTGLSLKISGLRTTILQGRADIEGLKLFNPRQFKDRVMLELGRIYMDYDYGALLRRNIHLNELDIELKEFMVVKDEKGELNLSSLRVVKYNKAPKNKKAAPKSGLFTLKINKLHLRIGKVVYKDYTHGKSPRVKVYNINMNETFRNIKDIHNLISLVMLKALSKTDIGLLAGFNLELLRAGVVGKSIVVAEKVTSTVYKGVKKLIRMPFQAIKGEQ